MALTVTDIFNRPPAIADDTLRYTLYPPSRSQDKAAVSSLAACIIDHVHSRLSPTGFLWHRDSFELKVVPDPDHKAVWFLSGTMRVGDSVDDEWCVVWLLKEISQKWDVAISYAVLRRHPPASCLALSQGLRLGWRVSAYRSCRGSALVD
jgi:hypothetical protein